jgi:hypothetical protein
MANYKIINPLQGRLFDDPEPIVRAAPKQTTFDISKLKPTWHEGEPYVLDLDLGQGLNYRDPIQIRQLIRRLKDRPSWGTSYYRDKKSTGGRPPTEHLLTEKQVVLVCMRSELPNIDEVQSLIADVFIAWRHGKVRAIDTETEVELQEATDRAFDAAPDLMILLGELARAEHAIRAAEAAERAEHASLHTLKVVLDNAAKKPKPPTKEATDCSEYIVRHKFRELCPCCQDAEIMKDGKLNSNANWDHWENKDWKRGPYDGWYVCRDCNVRFENNDEAFRADSYDAWRRYLKHVRWYFRVDTKLDL